MNPNRYIALAAACLLIPAFAKANNAIVSCSVAGGGTMSMILKNESTIHVEHNYEGSGGFRRETKLLSPIRRNGFTDLKQVTRVIYEDTKNHSCVVSIIGKYKNDVVQAKSACFNNADISPSKIEATLKNSESVECRYTPDDADRIAKNQSIQKRPTIVE